LGHKSRGKYDVGGAIRTGADPLDETRRMTLSDMRLDSKS
jgi:hypothetical protein